MRSLATVNEKKDTANRARAAMASDANGLAQGFKHQQDALTQGHTLLDRRQARRDQMLLSPTSSLGALQPQPGLVQQRNASSRARLASHVTTLRHRSTNE